jgi:hypothetical protein
MTEWPRAFLHVCTRNAAKALAWGTNADTRAGVLGGL